MLIYKCYVRITRSLRELQLRLYGRQMVWLWIPMNFRTHSVLLVEGDEQMYQAINHMNCIWNVCAMLCALGVSPQRARPREGAYWQKCAPNCIACGLLLVTSSIASWISSPQPHHKRAFAENATASAKFSTIRGTQFTSCTTIGHLAFTCEIPALLQDQTCNSNSVYAEGNVTFVLMK